MDITTIAAGIGSLKTAFELTASISNLRDESLIKAKILELQNAILSAQSSAMEQQLLNRSLLDEIDKTRKNYAELQDSIAQLENYELVDYGDETFAYEFKGDERTPAHKICPNCYSNGKKSILQFSYTQNDKRSLYSCQNCKAEYQLGRRVQPQPRNSSSRGSWMTA
jgi:formate dehydrogenase maturation protein FdhE